MPDQLADQTLITYPVDKQRLDVFTAFLDPADVEPAAIRKAELTPIIAQLVASNRGGGAAELGADGIHEPGLAAAVPAGAAGVWRTLYATVRSEDTDASYIDEFLTITRDVCFKTLSGIKRNRRGRRRWPACGPSGAMVRARLAPAAGNLALGAWRLRSWPDSPARSTPSPAQYAANDILREAAAGQEARLLGMGRAVGRLSPKRLRQTSARARARWTEADRAFGHLAVVHAMLAQLLHDARRPWRDARRCTRL